MKPSSGRGLSRDSSVHFGGMKDKTKANKSVGRGSIDISVIGEFFT